MTEAEIVAIVEGVADMAALTREMGEVLLAECDALLSIHELQRLYPQIPNRRWVYRHQTKLGAKKVEGRRSLRFSLRAVRSLLGPPVSTHHPARAV